MPTYEYACNACGAHIEVVQRFDDEPLRTCARCGGDLRKVYHPAGIVFRGSGFYATDSRASKGDGAKKAGDGAKKEPAKKEGAKTDASSASGGAKEKSA